MSSPPREPPIERPPREPSVEVPPPHPSVVDDIVLGADLDLSRSRPPDPGRHDVDGHDPREVDTPETRARFLDLLHRFGTAMLVTFDADSGLPRSRPLAVAEVGHGGDLWFATTVDSAKVDDIRAGSTVAITMQSASAWLSLTGEAEIVRDPGRVRAMWSEAWRAWFPNGPDDPSIALLHVHPTQGEYWDERGVKGVRFLLRSARALLRRRRADRGVPREHGIVSHL